MHIVEYGYVYARVYIYIYEWYDIYMKWNGMIWYDMIYTYVNIHYINYIYIIWICISIIRIARKDHKEGGFLQVGHNLDSELIYPGCPWLTNTVGKPSDNWSIYCWRGPTKAATLASPCSWTRRLGRTAMPLRSKSEDAWSAKKLKVLWLWEILD